MAKVRIGGRDVHRDQVIKVGVLVHPHDRDEDAPMGLYTLVGGPPDDDGTYPPERTVAYSTIEQRLREVAQATGVARRLETWVDNQMARLLQFRRLFVVLNTGEVYT